MARAIIPLVVVGALAVGLWVFWNPTICTQLNQLTAGQFDMCSFQSTVPEPTGGDTGKRDKPKNPDGSPKNTTVSSPALKKLIAHHHQKLITHNNVAIHAAHKQQLKKDAAAGHIKANQIPPGGPHCTPICKQIQCAGCPPPTHDINGAPLPKANLAEISHYRMSYN